MFKEWTFLARCTLGADMRNQLKINNNMSFLSLRMEFASSRACTQRVQRSSGVGMIPHRRLLCES